MKQQVSESVSPPVDTLKFLDSGNLIQSSSSTEEMTNSYAMLDPSPNLVSQDVGTRILYDYNTSESFYEIDVAELNMTLYSDDFFKEIFDDLAAINNESEGILPMLSTDDGDTFPPTESDDFQHRKNLAVDFNSKSFCPPGIQSNDDQFAAIKPNDSSLPIVRPSVDKSLSSSMSDQSINLSKSVAVTITTPSQLQLLHPLEETYRPRYKSDYFPQKGAVRRPRYIADNARNHFVTIQIPKEYGPDFKRKSLCVSLITTFIPNQGHFYSPYKFQVDNDDAKVPDRNPMYLAVRATETSDFFQMRLHLVLIKSKLDQLSSAQPLKSFPHLTGGIQNIVPEETLTPKELINKYQLDKAHLAFTLCTQLPNGSYEMHADTTVLSSVITETSIKPSASATNSSTLSKRVQCPSCSHCFDLSESDLTNAVGKRKSMDKTTKSTSNSRTNKKKKKSP